MSRAAWWRGQRGEWYVVIQSILFGLIAAGPTNWHGGPAWGFPNSRLLSLAGAVLLIGGAALALAGVSQHGPGPSALPYPGEGAVVETGPYRVVRHPIYCGASLVAVGWALLLQGWLTLAYAALLVLLFDAKARREERWLVEKFPSYADYQRRVRKLVPFIY